MLQDWPAMPGGLFFCRRPEPSRSAADISVTGVAFSQINIFKTRQAANFGGPVICGYRRLRGAGETLSSPPINGLPLAGIDAAVLWKLTAVKPLGGTS